VVEKLDGWQVNTLPKIHWENGAPIPYLGELLNLRVETSLFATAMQRHENELCGFITRVSEPAQLEKAVTCWYQHEARLLFAERVAYYANLLNVVPSAIKLTSAQTQWGSCTAQAVVRLNWRLIKLPLRLIDYVVVHELAHLREMNHSAKFWQVVAMACPDYAKLRSELKSISIGET